MMTTKDRGGISTRAVTAWLRRMLNREPSRVTAVAPEHYRFIVPMEYEVIDKPTDSEALTPESPYDA